ncbi:hypothetical protein F4778DRAFT_713990 [Xylariomycetidae sp. FL2044]|nr:hypothetical protein F4778DRAFT_713990 [Xylariomycetidae sp. FL2044]
MDVPVIAAQGPLALFFLSLSLSLSHPHTLCLCAFTLLRFCALAPGQTSRVPNIHPSIHLVQQQQGCCIVLLLPGTCC